jgi:cysteine-rich repeat protein
VRLITNLGVLPEIALDCAKWAIAGVGFRYRDKDPLTGRSISMKLSAGKLSASVKGPPYANAPVVGPVSFVETRVTIGSAVLCGRWSAPPGEIKRNQAAKVQIKGPTAACQVVCGNSIAEDGEECDDGTPVNGDGCDDNCTVTACGNSIQTSGEGCDDGNTMGGDGCRANCTVEACGDGITDPLEDCDDSNTVGGDCCSATCDYETAGSPCTSDSNPCTNDVCNGSGVCQHPNNTAPCNDLDGCTITDTCAGGTCQGTLRAPWFNEIDYDDFFGVLDDRDEFVEIAGPGGRPPGLPDTPLRAPGGDRRAPLRHHHPPGNRAAGRYRNRHRLLRRLLPQHLAQCRESTGLRRHPPCSSPRLEPAQWTSRERQRDRLSGWPAAPRSR